MNIEWGDIATIISMLVAVGALYRSFRSAPTELRNTSASTIKSLNESVDLAMDRAFVAEKALADEKKFLLDIQQQEKEKSALLEKRLATLEEELSSKNALPYRISLEVILGRNPSIQKGIIEHIPERRLAEKPFDEEKRKL